MGIQWNDGKHTWPHLHECAPRSTMRHIYFFYLRSWGAWFKLADRLSQKNKISLAPINSDIWLDLKRLLKSPPTLSVTISHHSRMLTLNLHRNNRTVQEASLKTSTLRLNEEIIHRKVTSVFHCDTAERQGNCFLLGGVHAAYSIK